MDDQNPFVKALRGVRVQVAKTLDVTDLLLDDLVDKEVITTAQRDEILVSCFTLFDAYC